MTVAVWNNARSWATRASRLAPGSTARSGREVHRFDGERAFVARGGATVGDVKASWSMAELSVSSTNATLRSRPGGLFDDLVIERGTVSAIGVCPSELGTGITFGDAWPEVVFWPTDARAILEALRDRGWPTQLPR